MNVSEWKQATRKTVTLKSGLDVVVRRLSPFAINEKGGIPGVDNIPQSAQTDMTAQILRAAIISPKIGDGPDEIDLLDFNTEDTTTLIDAIVGKTEVTEKNGVPLAPTVSNEPPQS